MSRAIEIIDTSGFYWAVSIDGNVIHLGKRLCRVDFGNADNLNSVLKDIEDVFIWRHTFSDVQSRTNTFNLLILLDSIYYESTSELFQYHCAEIMKQCDTPFAETFTKVFGSCPEKKYRRLSIVSEISKIYKDIHFQFYGPLKLKRSKYASSSQFCVKYTSSIGSKSGTLYFPNQYPKLEVEILKASILNMLSAGATLSTCSGRIHDACFVFDYFESKNLSIAQLNQAFFFSFYKYLKTIQFEVWHRNRYLQTLQVLAETGEALGVLIIPSTLPLGLRWKNSYSPKRAPENQVIKQVDRLFFNLCNDIPLGYRVMYFTLRLRTHRISEVIAMSLDCISYPEENVFTISVPTAKETAYHVPVFHQYSFLANGVCESIYYKLLMQQHDYALSMQEHLKPQYQGYLFVHPKLPRIITTNDFNDYLSKLCTSNNIVDSDGNATKITSHDLRHINVCERLQGNIISATETMVECNHSSLDQTLGYGYPAKKDEAKHLADITKQIPLFGEQKKVTCLQVPSFKYSRLLDEPNTRIIPGYGICRNDNCKPQFEKCIACESFSPDPACRDFFSAAIDLLSKRNQQIIKRHGDSKVLTHNEEMIRLYKKCLARIESNLS